MKRKRVLSPLGAHTVIAACQKGCEMQDPLFSRMTDDVFHKQKGNDLLAYVDDIVVKSDKKETHIQDLQETFVNLYKSSLKLNPDKCIFGI